MASVPRLRQISADLSMEIQYSTVQYSADLAGVAGYHVHRDEEEAEEVQQPRALHHQEVAVADVDKSE